MDNASSLDGKSGTEIANIFLQMAADPEYSDDLAYVVAYFIEYEQAHPEFAGQINNVLREFGMDDFTKYVDITDGVLNFSLGPVNFDTIAPPPFGFSSHSGVATHSRTRVELQRMRAAEAGLRHLANLLGQISADVDDLANAPVFTQRLAATSGLQENCGRAKVALIF